MEQKHLDEIGSLVCDYLEDFPDVYILLHPDRQEAIKHLLKHTNREERHLEIGEWVLGAAGGRNG